MYRKCIISVTSKILQSCGIDVLMSSVSSTQPLISLHVFVLAFFMGRTLEVCPGTLDIPCIYACDTPISKRSLFPYKVDNS
jgi:hypothetical protein